jgi:hypothetical protein
MTVWVLVTWLLGCDTPSPTVEAVFATEEDCSRAKIKRSVVGKRDIGQDFKKLCEGRRFDCQKAEAIGLTKDK